MNTTATPLRHRREDPLRDALPIVERSAEAAARGLVIPTALQIDEALSPAQRRIGDVADAYFQRLHDRGSFAWVPYTPIGRRAVWIATRQTGPDNLWPSTAFACLEQEAFKPMFGADWGTVRVDRVPFAWLATARWRVEDLTAHVRAGGVSNGCGLGQVTYGPYLLRMEELGGGWRPHVQMYMAFNILNDLLNANPGNYLGALEAYNDGSVWNNPHNPYEWEFKAKHDAWKVRLGQ